MQTSHNRVHTPILWGLGAGVTVLAAWSIRRGLDYYLTPVAQRVHHPGFRLFRSAGEVGHGLGILGSAMVLLMLLYSVRKRMRVARGWGDLRVWLRYHIFLGVAGPLLITLHTALKIDGLVAVSYWSMVAVALSGVLGRYLYQQVPRNVLGEALSLQESEEQAEALLVELTSGHDIDQRALGDLEQLATGRLEGRPSAQALAVLPLLNLRLTRELREWSATLAAPRPAAGEVARRWVVLVRRIHLFHLIRDVFHWWHVLHKPFATIMILVMFVHIGVAVALGYTWRF